MSIISSFHKHIITISMIKSHSNFVVSYKSAENSSPRNRPRHRRFRCEHSSYSYKVWRVCIQYPTRFLFIFPIQTSNFARTIIIVEGDDKNSFKYSLITTSEFLHNGAHPRIINCFQMAHTI